MNPLAVIDVETTGLNPYQHDRVIEIAVVLVQPEEGILTELTTLVNPERDVGPTSIHALTASDLINAPRFADIAANLVDCLQSAAILVGHNVRFDVSFLQAEYRRFGLEMPLYTTLDTMVIAGGGTLSTCCAEHGIKYDGRAHAALHDARTTTRLLQKILLRNPNLLTKYESCKPPAWPTLKLHAVALSLARMVRELSKRLAMCNALPND